MDIFAQQQAPLGFITLVFFAAGAGLVTWAVILERLYAGEPILPYQPRRRVPWRFVDLLAVLAFSFIISIIVTNLAQFISGVKIHESTENIANAKTSVEHPIVQLLAARNWTAVVLCILVGVVVAPIVEEMFFRVLLQGWLENADRGLRRRMPVFRKLTPRAVMPIFISSLIFASQHFREAAPQKVVQVLILLFSCDIVISLLLLAFFILWTRWRAGATAADLGWAPKKLAADVQLGLITFMAIAVPVYAIQILAPHLVPKQIAPDPIAIFFFAVPLGILYYRTHRVAPSIVAHMALNASSLALFFISQGQ